MSNELPAVVKQVLKLYDMSVDTSVKSRIIKDLDNDDFIRIRANILFKPKEYNSITPESVLIWGVWDYYKYKIDFHDMIYLRDIDMPILAYIDDDYNLDEFVTEVARNAANNKFMSLGVKTNYELS